MKKNLFVTVAVLSLAVVLSSCGASYNTIKRMQKIEEGRCFKSNNKGRVD